MSKEYYTRNKRVCVGIRTNRFGEAEKKLYQALLQYFSREDVFFVVDETQDVVYIPPDYQKVSFNKNTLEKLALLNDFKRVGWLCGDYFYYVLHDFVKASSYWLIEPDVHFTYSDVSEFFRLYESLESDFMAPHFGLKGPRWGWYQRALQISSEVYGCAFPITRMSAKAAGLLLRERKRLSTKMRRDGLSWKEYPNDESFTATTAMALGLKCINLVEASREAFSHFTVHYPFLLGEEIPEYLRNKVLHPALRESEFWVCFEKKFMAVLNRSEIKSILRLAIVEGDEKNLHRIKDTSLQVFSRWLNTFYNNHS